MEFALTAEQQEWRAEVREFVATNVTPDNPGIEIRPLVTWADFRTNETFFTDGRVPRRNLIGEVNRGRQYLTGALGDRTELLYRQAPLNRFGGGASECPSTDADRKAF